MKLLGWNLMNGRRKAGESDWGRQYLADDVPAGRSLNRRDCPHPRRKRKEWFGADGSHFTFCSDCGTVFE